MQCEKPKEPRDGFIVPKDEKLFDVGEKIWFKCDRGFDLNGVKDLKCLSNGRWSAPFPRCDRKNVLSNYKIGPQQRLENVAFP